MTGPDVIDHMAVLAATPPFDRLTARELLLVANHVQPRSFAAGATLIEAGQAADRLYIVVTGGAVTGNRPTPPLFDAASVLFSLSVDCDYRAGPDGLQALCLAKPHLFTIARECPDFIAGLIDPAAIRP